jgi:hypothetical protein
MAVGLAAGCSPMQEKHSSSADERTSAAVLSHRKTTYGGFGKTFWEIAVLTGGFALFGGVAWFVGAGE